jgi:hypothetical protein
MKCPFGIFKIFLAIFRGRHGRDRMVVGLMTIMIFTIYSSTQWPKEQGQKDKQ